MADPLHTDWWHQHGLTLIQWIVGSIVTATWSVALWMGRKGALHWRRINRHEERLDAAETELGLTKLHRETCGKAPMGEALNTELQKLKTEDEALHRRINKCSQRAVRQEKVVGERLARMETNIDWLCRELGRDESNEKK